MTSRATPLRAGVYGRESKDKTKSVDDQLAAGLAAVSAEGWQLASSYDDGSSASRFATKARKDWRQLLADIQAGQLDVVVLWESSRGSREPVDWFRWLGECRTAGVLIHVISHDRTYDVRRSRDWKLLAEDGVDAAYETERSSERVRRGVAAAAVNGTPHGAVPYGYLRRYDPATKVFAEQVPNPETAPVVREVFARVARNDPIARIVEDLNRRQVPSPAGRLWGRQGIRALIRNAAYNGQRVHNGTTYTACWKPLVDARTFTAANAVLDTPGRAKTKPGKRRWLLTYLATSPCGAPLHGQPERTGRKAMYACLGDGCVGIGQAELDEYVTRVVVERLSRPDARDMFVADDDQVAAAKDEIALLERQLDEARDSYGGPDGISAASLAAIERKLVPMIEAANTKVIASTVPTALVDLVTTDHVRQVWDGLPLAG
ncbi:MAG TPA: recombinase family protein, partial [Micromonosporaceae bacterium]|nr:recombinase family protein [Micromonosporaceae bacterium]